jgi:hypothetical protein
VRITDSQKEALAWGTEELQNLQSIVERIFDQNIDHGSSEDLQAIGKLSELVAETAKAIRQINKRNL